MNRAALFFSLFAMIGVSLLTSTGWAISLGQVDDFQDGTAQGWFHATPSPVPPANAPDAGPNGAGDNALLVRAIGGGGPASRLVARNTSQWTGDFSAAGVNAISMDLQNPNAVPLDMRIAIASVDGGGSWTGRYVSTVPVTLPAAGPALQWHSVVFSLSAADMTQIGSGDSLTDVLTDVGEFRLLHNSAPDWRGAVIRGDFLADNIRAIPEPSSMALIALVLGGLAMLRVANPGRR